ncbi:hypothetical protein [Brevibacillus brevis]|uniref:hypothetical protein n=1 Tax=Brevibacillus brevis TaxID=1393 RepID=UPI00165E89DB|nr:hypothetical protein [Brevibacillus brevis]
MKKDDRVSKLIDKLASDTKNGVIIWQRFLSIKENNDHNRLIHFFCENLFLEGETITEEISYYAIYKGGLIFVFTLNGDYNSNSEYLLTIQKDHNSLLKALNPDYSFKSDIKRLIYLIETQISDNDDFLDKLLED